MRTIVAGALDRDKHVGVLATHHGAPNPREIVELSVSLTFALIEWGDRTATSVSLDTEITIHDGPGDGP